MKDERKAFGEELAKHRLDQGLSLEDVVRDTKIRRTLLEALESGQFDKLPPPVFVAGYLQAYAKRVGIEPEGLVSRYKALLSGSGEDVDEAARPVPRPARPGAILKVVATLVVVAAAVGAGIYLWQRVPMPEEPAPAEGRRPSRRAPMAEPAAPQPTPPEPAVASPQPDADHAPPPAAEAAPREPAGQSAPAAAGTTPALPAPAPGPGPPPPGPAEGVGQAGDLVLEFSNPCWLELWADGQRKVFRQVGAGERLALKGKSFRAVTIGDSGAVALYWHGKPLALPAGTGKVVHDLLIPTPEEPKAVGP